MNRRQFTRAAILGGSTLALAGYFGSLKKNWSLVRVGFFPQIFSDYQQGYKSTVSLQNASTFSGSSPDGLFELVFLDPAGRVTWHNEFSLDNLTSRSVTLPDGLGWGSLIVTFKSNPSTLLVDPEIIVSAIIRNTTPFGEDGHHCSPIPWGVHPDSYNHFQSCFTPTENETLNVAILNPHDSKALTQVQIFGGDGRLIFDQSIDIAGLNCKYLVFGEKMANSPKEAIEVKNFIPGEGISIRPISTNRLCLNSWWIKTKSPYSFTDSHGVNIANDYRGYRRYEPKVSSIKGVGSLLAKGNWFTSELACLGGHPFSDDKWSTRIIVPNLTDRELVFLPIVFDVNGDVLARPEIGLDWPKNAPSAFRVPANGVANISLEDSLSVRFSDQKFGSLLCNVGHGQNYCHFTLVKVQHMNSAGEFSLTHMRPGEHLIEDDLARVLNENSINYRSDYWTSNLNLEVPGSILIQNLGDAVENSLQLALYDESGERHSQSLAEIPAGGLIWTRLPNLKGNVACRVTSRSHPIKTSYIGHSSQGWSMRHGSSRIKRRVTPSEIPKLPSFAGLI